METLEITWPVRREALVIDREELDQALGVPKCMSPLEISDAQRGWQYEWPEYESLAPCWILRDVLNEVAAGKTLSPLVRPERVLRHIDGSVVQTDGLGRPLNPCGRNGRNVATGWYWYPGPNWAADNAAVCRRDGRWWILMIRRADNKKLALPGGMCDMGELPAITAPRELLEETGFRAGSGETWTCIQSGQLGPGFGYAWTETALYLCRVRPERMEETLTPDPAEVLEAQWLALDDLDDRELHGGHDQLLARVKTYLAMNGV